MFTHCGLENFNNVHKNYKKTELVDISDIEIDPSQPIAERMKNYLIHIKNPYFFMCGEVPVSLSFLDNGITLSEKLQEHFIRQKQQ